MIRSSKSIHTLVYLAMATLVWGQDEPMVEEPDIGEEVSQEQVDLTIGAEEEGVVLMEDEPVMESEPLMEDEILMEPETFMEDEMMESTPLPDLPDMDFEMPTEDEVMMELPGADTATEVSRDAETISVDFPDEEIRIIIRNVAELYDLNVVIPDTLVGSTSLKLRNVSWRQVFDVVLEPIGFTYVEDRNIIKIRSIEELISEPVTTRVFVIDYATAGELQASIAPLVDSAAGGRIQVDSRSNALVITERPSKMNDIQVIIERLDRPTAQVMIESKFIEITNRDTHDIGINWSSLAGYGVSAGPLRREWDRTQTSDATDTTDDETVDTTMNSTSIGTTAVLPGGFTSTTDINNDSDTDSTLTRTLNLVTQTLQGRIDSAVFNADAFQIVLSALNTLSDSELVSNPTVVTLNNTPAQINIGEEFPIPSYTYNDERGTFEVSGFEFRPIGIILKVTPQVNSAGFINLHIKPEVSSRVGTVNFGGAAAAQIPIIATRKTESTITIKDGFTLAIGGLVEKTITTTSNKVPLLGDIPVLGRLFRSDSDTEDRRNLIIFITAKTLNPDGSSYKDVFSPRALNSMGVTADDAPGHSLSDSEEALYQQIQEARDALEVRNREAKLQKQLDTLRSIQRSGNLYRYRYHSKKKKLE